MALTLRDVDVRIVLLQAIAYSLHIFNGKTKVIESGAKSGLALQQCESDHAVTQVAAVFIVFSFFISHAVGDLFHAKNRLVKVCLTIPVLGHDCDVPDTCKHGRYPPVSDSSQSCCLLSTGADGAFRFKRRGLGDRSTFCRAAKLWCNLTYQYREG